VAHAVFSGRFVNIAVMKDDISLFETRDIIIHIVAQRTGPAVIFS